MKLLITRPSRQSARLAASLTAAGVEVMCFPALEIEATPEHESFHAALAALEQAALVIFPSANAAEIACAAIGPRIRSLSCAAVGQATAARLRELGAVHVIAPAHGADSEALLALPLLRQMANRRVVLFRGLGGREKIARELRERGAEVIEGICYRRLPPTQSSVPVLDALEQNQIDAVSVMSTETLDNLLALLGERGARLVKLQPLLVPHPRIAQAARERGFVNPIVTGALDQDLIAHVVCHA